jgi:tetratricopeptide (TPR) repeat protein
LRGQLMRDPHDREAHKQLEAIPRKQYAFRAEMDEDAVWLKNNPDDYSAEISMRSIATTINDPEFAIVLDHYILAHANRADYPEGYDSVSDRLAFLLLGRGKFSEALVLLKKATVLTPNDAGVWENLGDGQVRAEQFSEAVTSYKKSLDLDGNQEGTHEGLALAYFGMKDYVSSAIELNAAISVYNAQYHGGPPTDSWHQMIKNINKATKTSTDRGLANLHLKLAKTLSADKKYSRAIEEVDTAMKFDDGFTAYLPPS